MISNDDMAAMTEPLAVGSRACASRLGDQGRCGPGDRLRRDWSGRDRRLKLMGIAPIIAADFHLSRRDMAIANGRPISPSIRARYRPMGLIPDLGCQACQSGV